MKLKIHFISLSLLSMLLISCATQNEINKVDEAESKEGEALWTVEGTYDVGEPNTLMGGVIIFKMNEESSEYLATQVEHVYGHPDYFWFSNWEEAQAAFGLDIEAIFEDSVGNDNCYEKIEGDATITVTNFKALMRETAGYNKMEFVDLVEVSPYKYSKSCN